ncbi:MAG: DUF1501 domain-containing protein [Planctomycetota bacterium]|nr:DUF1501 domain-containing protein [Planctomycetota bacterium]
MSHHSSCNDAHACAEYNELSRRGFLARSAAVSIGALAASAWLPRVALAREFRSTQRDVIVSIFLRGASDGLTLVPPHGESAYYAARPVVSVPAPGGSGTAINLDGFFGLHPAFAPLMPAYQNNHLLVLHATGQSDTSRSHFQAQRVMELGDPADPLLNTGWLGRHLYSVDPIDPNALLRAVGISTGLQQHLVGGPRTLPIPNLDNFGLLGAASSTAARQDALSDMYATVADPLKAAALTTAGTIDLLNTINFAGYVPGGNAVYPNNGFGLSLKSAAALIKAQVGVEAIAVDLGGWDTHVAQGSVGGALDTLIQTLVNAIAAFYTDMIANAGNPTFTLVVVSEFGRRLNENGSAGTDHGHGNAMFVLGNCVTGGRVLANWPGLAPGDLFEGKDLAVTIDYRDILAEIIQNRLGNNDLGYIFPGFTPTFRGVTC